MNTFKRRTRLSGECKKENAADMSITNLTELADVAEDAGFIPIFAG